MCIFNSDTVVESTQIFSGLLSPTRRVLAYSNNVTVPKGGTVMLLPIPTDQKIKFYDTTKYSGFLNTISTYFKEKWSEGTRSDGSVKSWENVGIYKMSTATTDQLIPTLVDLEQPVPSWLYDLKDAYSAYLWLMVQIPAGQKISNQPLLIEYEQSINIGQLYVPMMDVHGNEEIKSKVERNHIVIISDQKDGVEFNFPDFPFNKIFKFSAIEFPRLSINRLYKNGDLWLSETNGHWDARFETPYVFQD